MLFATMLMLPCYLRHYFRCLPAAEMLRAIAYGAARCHYVACRLQDGYAAFMMLLLLLLLHYAITGYMPLIHIDDYACYYGAMAFSR